MPAKLWAVVAGLFILSVTVLVNEPVLADQAKTTAPPRRIALLTIPAPSLAGNLLGDPVEQPIAVYLPPSYFEAEKRYPVVYFLPGFGTSYDVALSVNRLFDRLMTSGHSMEFIFVSINGANSLSGSFFVNSPVTGGWEDFVVRDVVDHVDTIYRTVASAEGRALAGFSMGGFGAVNLGLRHPDRFSVVYAQAPGLLPREGLREAFPLWDAQFLNAYAAAFAPDPALPRPHGRVLAASDLGTGNEVETAWNRGYGALDAKIAAHVERRIPLRMIHIDVGDRDGYRWINHGSAEFERLAKQAGVPVELVVQPIDHSFTNATVESSMVPFLNAYLAK